MLDEQVHLNQEPEITEKPNIRPVGQLKTDRGILKFVLLSIITFGIYAIVTMSSVTNDINIIASRYDGQKTMHYCLLSFLVAPVTLGIAVLVWYHKMSNRIGAELKRREIKMTFSASDFWLWYVLGSIIVGIGPLVYTYKMFNAMNALATDYNEKG